jgi:hypothetical protein
MSSKHHDGDHGGHDSGHDGGHDGGHDDHAHHFDGDPITELPADEPRTPGWMPALGAGVFLVGAIYFLSADKAPDATAEGAQAAPPAVAQVAAPKPQPQPQPQPQAKPTATVPGGVAGLDPEMIKRVQDALATAPKKGTASAVPLSGSAKAPPAKPGAPAKPAKGGGK